ncbi:uncharacterized protein BDV17DRAFT_152284 [Aspergillus undulatus]|uniref:uncharacterized protein n=1 Tax=Aspergillus undulatus TaxID=1810928 RepID=UPI003CCCCA05
MCTSTDYSIRGQTIQARNNSYSIVDCASIVIELAEPSSGIQEMADAGCKSELSSGDRRWSLSLSGLFWRSTACRCSCSLGSLVAGWRRGLAQLTGRCCLGRPAALPAISSSEHRISSLPSHLVLSSPSRSPRTRPGPRPRMSSALPLLPTLARFRSSSPLLCHSSSPQLLLASHIIHYPILS